MQMTGMPEILTSIFLCLIGKDHRAICCTLKQLGHNRHNRHSVKMVASLSSMSGPNGSY